MKKLIAFTTLLVATSTFAQSTNSKTKIKTKDKTFTERIGFWYYGELDRNRISNDKNVTGDKKLDFLNYLNTSYELDSKSRINLTLRGVAQNGGMSYPEPTPTPVAPLS